MKRNKKRKSAIKVELEINQEYIKALIHLFVGLQVALQNYIVEMKKLKKEEKDGTV